MKNFMSILVTDLRFVSERSSLIKGLKGVIIWAFNSLVVVLDLCTIKL